MTSTATLLCSSCGPTVNYNDVLWAIRSGNRPVDDGMLNLLTTEEALREREADRREAEKIKGMYSGIERWRKEYTWEQFLADCDREDAEDARQRRLAREEQERRQRQLTPPASPRLHGKQPSQASTINDGLPVVSELSPPDSPSAAVPRARPATDLNETPTSQRFSYLSDSSTSSSPNVTTRSNTDVKTEFYELGNHFRLIVVPYKGRRRRPSQADQLRVKTGRVRKMSSGASQRAMNQKSSGLQSKRSVSASHLRKGVGKRQGGSEPSRPP